MTAPRRLPPQPHSSCVDTHELCGLILLKRIATMKIPALSQAAINEIETKIKYSFVNKGLLFQAFRRSSYCNEEAQMRGAVLPSNEVLEFCGDSILGAAVMTHLIKKYGSVTHELGLRTSLTEGDLSAIKSNLSNKAMLSSRMEELGLHRYLFMNHGDRNQNIQNTASVKEDLFESILGAVYLDSGSFDTAQRVAAQMLVPESYLTKMQKPKSPKNRLQELCQKHRRTLAYEALSVEGPENATLYTVLCRIDGAPYAEGKAQNLRNAETEAAKIALARLESELPTAPAVKATGKAAVTRLKEWNDKHKSAALTVTYLTQDQSEGNETKFYAECHVNGTCRGIGHGYNKKEAKEAAAKEAVTALENQGILID